MIEPIPDCSHWDGQINWTKFGQTAKAAIIRAGSINKETGFLYKDYRWEENAAAGPLVVPCGTYFYFRCQWNAINQARFYADLLRGKTFSLPPVLDIESNDTGLSKTAVQTRARAFLEELELQTGVKPMIYTRASWWNTHCGRTGWASQYKLWVAHYTTRPEPYIPWDWENIGYEVWQYTDSAPGAIYGINAAVDVNRAKDTFLPHDDEQPPSDAVYRLWNAAKRHGWEL